MLIPDYIDALPGYRGLDDATRFAICNGCGSAKAKIKAVPNHLLWLSIIQCCYAHDFGYHMGKTLDDKRKADLQFLTNMMETVNRESVWLLKRPRRQLAGCAP